MQAKLSFQTPERELNGYYHDIFLSPYFVHGQPWAFNRTNNSRPNNPATAASCPHHLVYRMDSNVQQCKANATSQRACCWDHTPHPTLTWDGITRIGVIEKGRKLSRGLGTAICSQFAYISVRLLSLCLHVWFSLQMCIISPTYGYDLHVGGLSRDKTDFDLLWLTIQGWQLKPLEEPGTGLTLTVSALQTFAMKCLHAYTLWESSLESHTLHRERKGLVMLQLPICHRGTQLLNMAVR